MASHAVLFENHEQVERLRRAVRYLPHDFRSLRHAVALLLAGDPPPWRARMDPETRERFRCRSLAQFVEAPAPLGLGTDAATLRRLLGDCPERVALELALARGPGNPTGANQHAGGMRDTVTVSSPPRQGGNSTAYAVGRLARQRPDLLDRVKAGETSCHAAMVAAGLRKARSPYDWLCHWWRRASPAERERFAAEVCP